MPRKTNGLLDSFGTLSPRVPSARERIAGLLADISGQDNRQGYQSLLGLLGQSSSATPESKLMEMSNPAGGLLGAYDAGTEIGHGNYVGGGLGLMGAMFLGPGAKTADHVLLKAAKEMKDKGYTERYIWRQTGWFQGKDSKWRFEIDDSKSAIDPAVTADFNKRAVGDQVPVRNADRFIQHPELFDAYPDLWRVNTRLEKGGGYPYQPSGHYFQRESGTENIGIDAATLEQARSLQLHELQHAVQQREGFAPGADANAVGMQAYVQAPGEQEAYNVQRRLFMTPEERKKIPPWETVR